MAWRARLGRMLRLQSALMEKNAINSQQRAGSAQGHIFANCIQGGHILKSTSADKVLTGLIQDF